MTSEKRTTESVPAEDPAASRVTEVARAILTNPSVADKPWTGLTVLATIAWWDPPVVRSTTAYYYTAEPMWDGEDARWEGLVFDPRHDLEAALIDLARTMAERDETDPWSHCLIQIDAATDALTTKFCYENDSPWKPDFERLDEWVEALRPPTA